MRTTEQTYANDLDDARAMMATRIPQAGFPEGEREKVISDALNNTWVEGMALDEWVDAAADLLGE